MSDGDLIITMDDVRASRLCSRGARRFLESYGFDWTDFLNNGIPASELLKHDDAYIYKVVEVARGRRQ